MSDRRMHWSQQALFAALLGVIVEGGFVTALALTQPPYPVPPPASADFFILTVTYAAVCMPLVLWGRAGGYIGAMGVGLFTLLTLVLTLLGTLGDRPVGANPLGPLTFAVLAVVLIVFGVIAWRGQRE